MDICFNELSTPSSQDFHSCIKRYAQTIKRACQEGFKKVRYSKNLHNIFIEDGITFGSYCRKNAEGSLILSTQNYPYIEDDDENADKYIITDVYLNRDLRPKCDGLGVAYIENSIGIAFFDSFWRNDIEYNLLINKEGHEYESSILCLSSSEKFDDPLFKEWKEKTFQNIPDKCVISYDEKKSNIKLRHDHGQDTLKEFSKVILKDEYVKGIIDSLPFHHNSSKFINKINDNGVIEIVLVKTDVGYGVAVQTTGINKTQTEWIANRLERKFKNFK